MCSLLRGNWAWLAEWTVGGNDPDPGNSGLGCSTKNRHYTENELPFTNPHDFMFLLFCKHFQTLVAEKQDHQYDFWCCKTAKCLHNFLRLSSALSLISIPLLQLALYFVPGFTIACNLARLGDRRERRKQREAERHSVKEGVRDLQEIWGMPKHIRRGSC